MSWEKNVRKVIPYVPGEQPKQKVIKLNTNECPYPPSPRVKTAKDIFDVAQLRLYPDPKASALTECLADYYGLEPEQVFVGVGSDDVLAMAFLTFFNSDLPILFPNITYSFYDVWAQLFQIPYIQKELDSNFRMKKEDYMAGNGGIIFPNPNAPTGVSERIDVIEEIIKANPDVVVIVDEAYIDFGGESVLPLIHKYDNLLVVQTFSKSRAMAGMRIGYAMGSPRLIQYLNDVKFSFNSYTMDRLTLTLGVEAVKDDVYFKEIVNKIIDTREQAKKELHKLGFTFQDSQANFVFATHGRVQAIRIFEELRAKNIIVRHFNVPLIDNYLRISIGTEEEMQVLYKALTEILEAL